VAADLGVSPPSPPFQPHHRSRIWLLRWPQDILVQSWDPGSDAFPLDGSQWNDSDSDGYGDNPTGNFPDQCPDQSGNSTQDGLGCPDGDGDGFSDTTDNCPLISNFDQFDYDRDLSGDVCDDDDDADGVPDNLDSCSAGIVGWASNETTDNDGDGCLDSAEDSDDDNDGVADVDDNCPLVANINQDDFDGDGLAASCDLDDDGDGVLDSADVCADTPRGPTVNADGCPQEGGVTTGRKGGTRRLDQLLQSGVGSPGNLHHCIGCDCGSVKE